MSNGINVAAAVGVPASLERTVYVAHVRKDGNGYADQLPQSDIRVVFHDHDKIKVDYISGSDGTLTIQVHARD